MNKVLLIGRLGKYPETRTIETGTKVATLNLATSEKYKDKAGEWQENTEWHRVVAWERRAEQAEKYQKGDLLQVEGKLVTRKWTDKDGVERRTTEVIADRLRLLHRNEDNKQAPASKPEPATTGPDDDLPF